MGPVHRRAGAEIQIAVPVRIEDGLQAGLVRNAYRSRRQAFVQIGIVRRINLKMLEEDPVGGVIEAECHSGIGLEPHTLM